MRNLYKELLSRQWYGKAAWEGIRDKELTSAPCFAGEYYGNEKTKIMIVGRAVNGWEVDFEDCTSHDAVVTSVLDQRNRMDDFASEYIVGEDGKKYYYAKSPFLRMMRQLVGAFTGTEENWQRRLVWSNLFKVAPRNGGNPSWKMIRDDIPLYWELLRREILQNKPNAVVFVTDMNFFDPYPGSSKYASFRTLMNEVPGSKSEYICAAGSFADDNSIKVIVCKRPERRPVAEIVKAIHDTYQALMQ